MKIEGPSKTQNVSKTKKAEKADKADAAFGEFVASAPQEAPKAAASSSIAAVDALLAVQSVEDPTARAAKKRMRVRADKLLGELDKLKNALLTGTMTIGHCIDIADVVASHRENIDDPGLTGILDEIDLRAQVEIAKMRKALEAQNNAKSPDSGDNQLA